MGHLAIAGLSWIIGAVAELPFDLVDAWAVKAAKKNSDESETADANSIHAWKYFPW